MVKFAKSGYGMFDNSKMKLKLSQGDIFVVTPEIEQSKEFQDGLRTGNFKFIVPTSLPRVRGAVGVTDEIVSDFKKALEARKPSVPQPEEKTPEVPEPKPETPEEPAPAVEEKAKEPAISFTEVAGKVKDAVAAIKECNDIAALKLAQKLDERKTVQSALETRIKELEG